MKSDDYNDLCNKIQTIVENEDVSIAGVRKKCEDAHLLFYSRANEPNENKEIYCYLSKILDMTLDNVVRAVFGDKNVLERAASTKIGIVDVNRLELSDKAARVEKKVFEQMDGNINIFEAIKAYISLLNLEKELSDNITTSGRNYEEYLRGVISEQSLGRPGNSFAKDKQSRVIKMTENVAGYLRLVYELEWDTFEPSILWNDDIQLYDERKIWDFDRYLRNQKHWNKYTVDDRMQMNTDVGEPNVNRADTLQLASGGKALDDFHKLELKVEGIRLEINERLAEANSERNIVVSLLQETREIVKKLRNSTQETYGTLHNIEYHNKSIGNEIHSSEVNTRPYTNYVEHDRDDDVITADDKNDCSISKSVSYSKFCNVVDSDVSQETNPKDVNEYSDDRKQKMVEAPTRCTLVTSVEIDNPDILQQQQQVGSVYYEHGIVGHNPKRETGIKTDCNTRCNDENYTRSICSYEEYESDNYSVCSSFTRGF